MPVTHHIGLELAERSFRLAEIRSTDGFPVVLRTDVRATSEDYSSEALHTAAFNRDLARAFVHELAEFLHARPVHSAGLTVVLATHTPLIAMLPVDPSLSFAEKRRHIAWECRTLLGADADTRLSVQSIPLERSEERETWLVTAMPHSTVSFLRTALGQMTFDVRAIEISHFTIENGIRAFMPGPAHGPSAMLGMLPSRCAVGIQTGREYRGFRTRAVTHHAPYVRQAAALLHDAVQELSAEQLDTLHIHGPEAAGDAAARLQELMSVPVLRFDPLARVSFLAGSDADAARRFPPSSLDAALCAAWKGALA